MRFAISIGAAIVLAMTGAAVAKEKKVAVKQGVSLCSTSANGKVTPKLDCKSTGTVVQGSDGSQNALEPRLGYSSSPWFVLSGF
ncbi:DUF680 domain-containing protein [Mesorhizobium sp. WSM4313]|nr:DUF680 domain-containing protein [Mesorhizobium sp. WSM4313]